MDEVGGWPNVLQMNIGDAPRAFVRIGTPAVIDPNMQSGCAYSPWIASLPRIDQLQGLVRLFPALDTAQPSAIEVSVHWPGDLCGVPRTEAVAA